MEIQKKKPSKNNPNKVNQYTLPDPRQALFLKKYLDPKSETFSNVLQSGLSVGYSREYSENLTGLLPNWLSENIGQAKTIQQAEKNLVEFLESNPTTAGELKVKADITKFTLERLSRKKWGNDSSQEPPKQVFLTFVNNPQFINAVKSFEENIKGMIENGQADTKTDEAVEAG